MKEQTLKIGRREFTLEAVLAMLSGVVITISGCGGSNYNNMSPTPTPTTSPPSGDKVGQISANHGHVAIITAAKLAAGGDLVDLDIRGSASHSHFISLTAAQIGQVAANQQVSVMSTTNSGHDHTVTFN
jgi:hypothetical protein